MPPPLGPSTGQTFYVATTGSDSNPGTLAAPWRTVQKAFDTLQPGQRALVRAGTYAESLDMDRAGTAAAPITVENHPGERPIVNGGGQRPLEVSSSGAYFRLRGFILQNSPYNSGGNVDLYGHHLEISGNEVRNAQDQGIYTDEDSHHAQILGNWIHHNGQGVIHQSHGIYLQGNDHLVANNVIHDHVEGFGIQVYDRNSRSIITANTVTGAGHSGIVVGGERRRRQHPCRQQRLRLQLAVGHLARLELPDGLARRPQRRLRERLGSRPSQAARVSTIRAGTGRPIRCSSTTRPVTCT